MKAKKEKNVSQKNNHQMGTGIKVAHKILADKSG